MKGDRVLLENSSQILELSGNKNEVSQHKRLNCSSYAAIMQIVGKRWKEMELLAIAQQLDTVIGGFRLPPGY